MTTLVQSSVVEPPTTDHPADSPAPRHPTLLAETLSRGMATLAVVSLAFVGYLLVISPLQHDRTQSVLRDSFAEQLSAQTLPAGGLIDTGSPVARLRIPALGLDEIVVEGTGGRQLDGGPGHRPTSPLPGQPGTAVIMGRSVTFGAPFRQLTRLRPADEVTVTTVQGEHTYRVIGVRRAGAALLPPLRADQGRLTLVGMEGDGPVPGLRLGVDRTVYVDAELIGAVQAAPPGRSRVQWPQEVPLAADRTGFVQLVLWLQLLAVAVAAFTWARYRWGRRESWVVGMPLLLALAVQVFHLTAVTLLPNLM
ncbi:sortase domain-bontaining protein [Micromonospora sp. NPDC093277]|uniref:sortase domain-containing protein n=1 Tax=Micromonospora sp. NPDC093277 TaxID=3364291 RepID=UPI0037F8F574